MYLITGKQEADQNFSVKSQAETIIVYLITGKQEADKNFSVKSQAETIISIRWSSEGCPGSRKQLR